VAKNGQKKAPLTLARAQETALPMTKHDVPADHPAAVLSREIAEAGADPHGQGGLVALLAGKPQLRAMVAAAAVSCLGAGRFIFDRDKKSWVELPDYSTRLKAAEFLRDTLDGKPIQATCNLNASVGGGRLSSADLLAGSPNAESVLAGMLEQVRSKRLGTGRPE
jgi:hypothetical protein